MNTEVIGGGWWVLSAQQKAEALRALPEQSEWTLKIVRDTEMSWAFDLEIANTFGERLVSGTNEALDAHFLELTGKEAEIGDEMMMTCSIEPVTDMTTYLDFIEADEGWEGSAFFEDVVTGMSCWLCPFTTVLWGHIPERIYLNLEPLSVKAKEPELVYVHS